MPFFILFALMNDLSIHGIHPVIEAIESGKEIEKIFFQRGLQGDSFKELELLTRKEAINTSYVPLEKLNRLTKNKNHQGVVAIISPISYYDLESLIEGVLEKDSTPLFLLLDQITDVRNFGAIIRTAECTAVDGIIVQKKGGAPVNADTIKTSTGAVFNIPICKVDHIKDAIYYLQGSGIQVIAASEKTDQLLYGIDLTIPTAIVMGSEGRGINPSVLKIVDAIAKLPMLGKTESLNVSVACGAFLYEVVRQRT